MLRRFGRIILIVGGAALFGGLMYFQRPHGLSVARVSRPSGGFFLLYAQVR